MPKFYISGIWKNDKKQITHAFIHTVRGVKISPGERQTEELVISLLKQGYEILAITWNYNEGRWQEGTAVSYAVEGKKEYLKSHKDKVLNDDLDKLINLQGMF